MRQFKGAPGFLTGNYWFTSIASSKALDRFTSILWCCYELLEELPRKISLRYAWWECRLTIVCPFSFSSGHDDIVLVDLDFAVVVVEFSPFLTLLGPLSYHLAELFFPRLFVLFRSFFFWRLKARRFMELWIVLSSFFFACLPGVSLVCSKVQEFLHLHYPIFDIHRDVSLANGSCLHFP